MSDNEYPSDVEGLAIGRAGALLELRLQRPERRNAITDEMVFALIDAIERAGTDESVRAVLLSAAGEHFSSGFDLGTRGESAPRARIGTTQRRLRSHVNRLIPTLLETQTPIVAAVRGWAIGLGLHIALASDFAVVASDSRLWAPFTSFGFTPDSGGSWLVPRLVGVARAKEMLMLSREVSGEQAARWGLVHTAVPESEVDSTARTLADELARAPTVAVGLTKLLVHRSSSNDLDDQLADEALALELSSRSEDFREYRKARAARRDPRFEGR